MLRRAVARASRIASRARAATTLSTLSKRTMSTGSTPKESRLELQKQAQSAKAFLAATHESWDTDYPMDKPARIADAEARYNQIQKQIKESNDASVAAYISLYQSVYQLANIKVLENLLDEYHKQLQKSESDIDRDDQQNKIAALKHILLHINLAKEKELNPAFPVVVALNRGLIARKIIREAKKTGRRTAIVCTELDKDSLAAKEADHVIIVKNIMDLKEVMQALSEFQKTVPAKIGIHPGYGLHAENPELPKACKAEGHVFIGPSEESMRQYGDKDNARKAAVKKGVPVVPGYDGDNPTLEEGIKIGFPLLVKAINTGGGEGNRVVNTPEELKHLLDNRNTGIYAGRKFIFEQRLTEIQHIEIQVFIDAQGKVRILNSRECSPQRRDQKIIEEAPAPIGEEAHAQAEAYGRKMGEDAASKGYRGPFTLELFFKRLKNGSIQFYFNEINTRLQVEHPPTEFIHNSEANIILWQFITAAGGSIPTQEEIDAMRARSRVTSSMEARVNAADIIVHDGKLLDSPVIGTISNMVVPASDGTGSTETGVENGSHVDTTTVNPTIMLMNGFGTSPDPDKAREEARSNLRARLERTQIEGIKTNIPYLLFFLKYAEEHPNEPIFTDTCKTKIDELYLKMLVAKQAAAQPLTFVPAIPAPTPTPQLRSFITEANPESKQYENMLRLITKLNSTKDKITTHEQLWDTEHPMDNKATAAKYRVDSAHLVNKIKKLHENYITECTKNYLNQDAETLNTRLADLHTQERNLQETQKKTDLSQSKINETAASLEICTAHIAAIGQVLEQRAEQKLVPAAEI